MFEYHTTRSGSTILICQMEDSHLINTIKLYCSKIKDCCGILESGSIKGMTAMGALIPQLDIEELKRQSRASLKTLHTRIQPYILEAALRGLSHQFTEDLQNAYGREAQFDIKALQKYILPAATDSLDGDGYEDDQDELYRPPILDESPEDYI